jgi:DNA-binding NtrC family response regulator
MQPVAHLVDYPGAAEMPAWTDRGIVRTVTKDSAVRRALVVDDELLIRWSLSQVLRDHGFEVVQADSAAAALATVRTIEKPFDVAMLDLRLPDCNDLSLLTTLRQLSPRTAIVLMSAFATPDLHQSALALGARYVISKPFELHDIPALLSRMP